MATILLIGTDPALLEGLTQSLAAAGHAPRIALALGEATELAHAEPPLVIVVERTLALAEAAVMQLPLARGGALMLFRSVADTTVTPLTPALQRAALADLALPLERHRLAALIQRVDERARAAGRGREEGPAPERRV